MTVGPFRVLAFLLLSEIKNKIARLFFARQLCSMSTPLSGSSMDATNKNEVSSAKAVILGALATGVNGPTWSAIKITFLTLGVCFTSMLALSFSSNDFVMIIHVTLLIFIGGTLFFLLNNFLAQTGLVSVEQQMEEMGLGSKNPNKPIKDS